MKDVKTSHASKPAVGNQAAAPQGKVAPPLPQATSSAKETESQKVQDLDKQKAELEAKKAKIHQAELHIAEMKKQLNDTQVELQKSTTSLQSNATLPIPSIAQTPAVPVVASAIVQNNTNNGTVSAT